MPERSVILAIACLLGLAAQSREIRLNAPDTAHGYVLVRVPDSPPPQQGFAVCFWYHGTGGQPNIGLLRRPDYPACIAIGMAYTHTPDTIEGRARRNWAQCQKVLQELRGRVRIDSSRVYVGGFSRGGWMAASIADMRPSGLRGAIIGGAGKTGALIGKGGKLKSPLSILVLIGEIDENFSAAQEALRYFRGIGAKVHYEEFRRQGHVMPPTPRLHNWFHVHLGQPDPAPFELQIAKAVDVPDPWQRYLACSELFGDAMLSQVDNADRLLNTLRETARAPQVIAALRPKEEFHKIVRQEVDIVLRLRGWGPQMRGLFERYDTLANSATGAYADSARIAAERILRMWKYQQSQNPAYGHPEHDRVVQAFKALGRRAVANGYRLPESEAERMRQLEARLNEIKLNPQATPGPPLLQPAALKAHQQALRALLNQSPPLPFGGLGR